MPLEPHQIEIIIHTHTREKWVRIASVDRGKRTLLKLAIKRVGINASLASKYDNANSAWSLLYSARETRKFVTE